MRKLIFFLSLSMIPAYMSAQDQQQEKQKTPVEIASEQADKLQEQLKLNNKQLFQVDSVLQNNITGVTADFEKLKKGGRMSSEAYIQVRDSWQLKTEEAFKKILTEEQFKKYMIFIGKMDNKGRMKKQPRY